MTKARTCFGTRCCGSPRPPRYFAHPALPPRSRRAQEAPLSHPPPYTAAVASAAKFPVNVPFFFHLVPSFCTLSGLFHFLNVMQGRKLAVPPWQPPRRAPPTRYYLPGRRLRAKKSDLPRGSSNSRLCCMSYVGSYGGAGLCCTDASICPVADGPTRRCAFPCLSPRPRSTRGIPAASALVLRDSDKTA